MACTFVIVCIPSFIYAQTDQLNVRQSFPRDIQYLGTTYLNKMQQMSAKTITELSQMELGLKKSIHEMIVANQRSTAQTEVQLDNEIMTQLIPEMKQLHQTVMIMQQQMSFIFDPNDNF